METGAVISKWLECHVTASLVFHLPVLCGFPFLYSDLTSCLVLLWVGSWLRSFLMAPDIKRAGDPDRHPSESISIDGWPAAAQRNASDQPIELSDWKNEVKIVYYQRSFRPLRVLRGVRREGVFWRDQRLLKRGMPMFRGRLVARSKCHNGGPPKKHNALIRAGSEIPGFLL